MAKFVEKGEIAVTVEGDPNTIYILPKMSFGLEQELLSRASQMKFDGKAGELDLGIYTRLLMELNIIRWEGPDFEGIACTPEAIGDLDSDDPLIEKVLQEVNTRNTKKREDSGSPNLS